MDPEDFRRLWHSVRNRDPDAYTALVAVVEIASQRLCDIAGDDRPPLPPPEERAGLWGAGRLAYELSLALTTRIKSGWGITADPDSENAGELIARLADAVRILPWPEYAPHSLGAIRAQALAESKRDTIDGYDNAWAVHRQARKKFDDFEKSLVGADKDYLIALHETAIQLALSEAGTACRTAERVIGQWVDGIDDQDEHSWIVQLYDRLSEAALFGEACLARVSALEADCGLVDQVDEKRMALVTAYRNPGVMTSRALLLLIPLCDEMARMGYRPPADYETWDRAREGFRERFETTFALIGDDVARHRPYSEEITRSIAQLRLSYAWLAPGRSLTVIGPSDEIPCLALNPLDDSAIEALSDWLTSRGFDGNAISSATMPLYVRAVQRLSSNSSRPTDVYLKWRRNYFALDRYPEVEGRRDRVVAFLGALANEGTE
jgi:hypothetical protein